MEILSHIPHVEVSRADNYFLLVNRRQTMIDNDELDSLARSIRADCVRRFGSGPLKHWSRIVRNIYFDTWPDPKYFAKVKWLDSKNPDFREALGLDRDSRDNDDRKKTMYAGNSLLNEMHLAGAIKEIVSSKEVGMSFAKAGIESIDFIEPLIGVIDRRRQQKIMFYPFAEGDILYLTDYFGSPEMNQAIEDLRETFIRNNIRPSDGVQLMIERDNDGKDRAHLMDIEFFHWE